jgi:acyl transferase domain-containing protein
MNVLTNPDIFAGLSKGQFLSKTGSCKTFDNDADGYCRGDGVATVILKRIEDAIADNDPILAIIRDTATNHSAEAISLVHPHVGAQQYLFQKIMDNVGVDPRDVNYVEMHGTGTQAGDAVEIESVTNVFAPRHHIRNNQQPLYIGSAKANIGHGEAVSGVSSLIKVILMFQKNMIPPHCGIKNAINRSFPSDLKQRGVRIASILTPFPKMANGKNRLVFINNFSAAGGNSAILVEDAPNREVVTTETDPRSTYVVTISAKSLTSFWKNARRLLLWMDRTSGTELSSLSYTTTARRQHYNYRLAFAVENMGTLYRILSTYLDAGQPPRPVSNTPPAIAFVFTGQGSQYTGMARSLFTESELFRKEIQYLDRIATSQGFPSILALIDGTSDHTSSESSVVSQLCMTCIQIALANVWRSWGLVPSVVIGHSLGEYAALHAAGVLSAFDTIYLVGKRAQLLESECSMHTHCMLAVKGSLNLEDLITICNSYPVEVACLNSPQETVLRVHWLRLTLLLTLYLLRGEI